MHTFIRSSCLAIFCLLTAAFATGQTVQCTASAGVPPILRSEGLTEQVGDYVIDCVDGIPTAAGFQVPMVTFTFALNAIVTSNLTNGSFNEALLIVDEPTSTMNPTRPMLNCGASGAPDNGSGPGTCAIISTGDPNTTHDGTANGYGAGAVCDGVGHPAANTYACGRPNVFQAQTVVGRPNVLQFSVPFNAPGPDGHRIFRLTNVRVNAAAVAPPTNSLVLSTITSSLTITGVPQGMSIAVANREIQVATLLPGMTAPAETTFASPILFREGFPSVLRTRNLSAIAVGDHLGTLSNGTLNGIYWNYNGGTRNPADVAQNVPGAVYNTEEGYTWQNNGSNRPPDSNPPIGFGNSTGLPLLGGPLTSAGFGGVDTGISAAGVAQQGTRIALRFTNIPTGGSVTLPTTVPIVRAGLGDQTGILALTSTDTTGAGPYTPRSGVFTASDNLAVYEVLFADPYVLEDANIPFTLSGFPAGLQLRSIMGFAPFYSSNAAGAASAALPTPRFSDPCKTLPCLSMFPNSGRTGDAVNAVITANPNLSDGLATQMLNGAQVKLVAAGQPDIIGNPAIVSGSALTTTFNLSGAAVGPREVVVIPLVGSPASVPGGFNVTAAPPCSYTVGPTSLNFSAAGGSGSLVVSPVPVDCPWTATTTDPTMFTLGAKQGQIQPYTVSANPATSSRFGTISIADKTVAVTQQGACIYQVDINPANKTLPAAGGTITASITTQTGCAWSAVIHNVDFIHATSPTSGSGSGVVTLSFDPNAGVTRLGDFSISAGSTQTYRITQSANCTVGTDVSTQMTVSRGPILSNFTLTRYTQQVTITNTSATPVTNPYLMLGSLTSQVTSPINPFSFCSGQGFFVNDTLAPGQSATLNFQFAPGKSAGGQPPVYTTRVVSF